MALLVREGADMLLYTGASMPAKSRVMHKSMSPKCEPSSEPLHRWFVTDTKPFTPATRVDRLGREQVTCRL